MGDVATAFVVALAVSLGSLPAMAGPSRSGAGSDDAIAVAKAKVEEGQHLYEQAQYEQALVAFQDAAAAYASPDFQFNIGLCHERMGEPAAAIRAFETYLRNKPEATDRAGVEHRIAELRRRLHEAESAARGPEETASPASPQTPPSTRSQPDVDVDQAAPPQARPTASPSSTPPVDAVDEDGVRGRRLVGAGAGLVAAGATLAVAGGVGFGLPASRRADRIDDAVAGGNPERLTMTQAGDIAAEGDQFRALQLVCIGVGVLVGVTGTALLAVGLRKRRADRSTSSTSSTSSGHPRLAVGGAGLTLEF